MRQNNTCTIVIAIVLIIVQLYGYPSLSGSVQCAPNAQSVNTTNTCTIVIVAVTKLSACHSLNITCHLSSLRNKILEVSSE